MAAETADLLLVVLTLALGFSMLRANLCLVACVRTLLLQRRWQGVAGLAIASSASGLVLLTAYLALPAAVRLPVESDGWAYVLLGGVLLGIGALINGGCYLGSIAYLGRGNLHYLFTLLGIGLSLRFMEQFPAWKTVMRSGAQMSRTPAAILGLVVFVLVVSLGIRAATRASSDGPSLSWRGQWSWPLAAGICGVLAGAVFARHPDWNYGSVIDSIAHADTRPFDWIASASVVALFMGAVASAIAMHRFHWPAFSSIKALRCLAGGALMAYGAAQIPGGNDTLLLWSMPGLTRYGWLAYAAMALTIVAIVATEQRLQRARPTA